jgi:L-phenylalanine/L-methionine N-acetyltransferase
MIAEPINVLAAPTPAALAEPATVAFRRLSPADAFSLAMLMRDPEIYRSMLDLPHPAVEDWQHTLSKLGPNDHWLCALAEDQLVGWGSLTVHADMARRHTAQLGVVVARAWWGRRVGSALMRELLNLADDWLNLQRVELSVFTGNARAVELYQRHGFEVEGTQRALALREGRYADAYLMSRLHPRPAVVGS